MPSLQMRASSGLSFGPASASMGGMPAREHLLVVVEPVHHAEALVQVVEHRHLAHALADVLVVADALEELERHHVVEDVDLAHATTP